MKIHFVFLILLFTGCASIPRQSLEVIDSDILDSDGSYVFAHLQMEKSVFLASNNWIEIERIGDPKRALLRFPSGGQIVVAKLPPGTYRVLGMVHTPGGPLSLALDSEITEHPIPVSASFLSREFTLNEGEAFYVGDYASTNKRESFTVLGPVATATFSSSFFFLGINCETRIADFKKRFESAGELTFKCVAQE